jgi:hypothetical protein
MTRGSNARKHKLAKIALIAKKIWICCVIARPLMKEGFVTANNHSLKT